MSTSLTPIRDICTTEDTLEVRAKITRKWYSRHLKTDALMSMDIILLDENEDHIHATIPIYLVDDFEHLTESKVYNISNFKVERIYMHKVVSHEYKIRFTGDTSVQENNNNVQISNHKFEIASFEELTKRKDNFVQSSDVLGRLVGIGALVDQEVQAKQRKVKKIVLRIQISRNKELNATFWGQNAIETSSKFINYKSSDSLVIVITSNNVKTYRGELSLSSTNATKIYTSPDIKEIASFVKGEPLTKEVQLIRKENEIFDVKAETMTVKEVKHQRSTAKEYYVICKVKITSINSSGSWHYQTCHSHYVKLEKDGSKYYCSKCKGFVTTPHRRFKVHVRAEDNSGSTTLTLFDSIVKTIIGDDDGQRILDGLSSTYEKNVIPIELSQIVGRSFTFKLKLTDYNLIHGNENFTVSTICDEENEETFHHNERNFSNDISNKECIVDSSKKVNIKRQCIDNDLEMKKRPRTKCFIDDDDEEV
ncbi:hypothetical protein Sjap_022609 [Stephania japonica]|uniref:Uncharacterized protein n=1 Tax=Stephania japonica TaxID=461633 RepID=A0AAP0EUK7_9MAGN